MLCPEPFTLFLVEDSDDDLFLFRRLLSKADINHPLRVATNGQAAIDQLTVMAADAPSSPVPRIVFVDLKLPLRSGFDVLEFVRSTPAFRSTVAIILSSSAELRDVKRAFALGAHGYLVKYPGPAVFRDIVRIVSALRPDAMPDDIVFPGLPRSALYTAAVPLTGAA